MLTGVGWTYLLRQAGEYKHSIQSYFFPVKLSPCRPPFLPPIVHLQHLFSTTSIHRFYRHSVRLCLSIIVVLLLKPVKLLSHLLFLRSSLIEAGGHVYTASAINKLNLEIPSRRARDWCSPSRNHSAYQSDNEIGLFDPAIQLSEFCPGPD